MIAKNRQHAEPEDWLSLREAAALTGKHENTVSNNRYRIKHKRDGYGSRAPLYFDRKSLLKWIKGYKNPKPVTV